MIPWIWFIEGAKTIRGFMESFSPMGFYLLSTSYYMHFISYGLIKDSLYKLINYGLINILSSLYFIIFYLLDLDIGLFVGIK